MNLILKEKFKHTDGDRVNTLKVKPQPDGTMIVWIYNGDRSVRFTLHKNTARDLQAFLEHQRRLEDTFQIVDNYNQSKMV